jgi:hypothetical protein
MKTWNHTKWTSLIGVLVVCILVAACGKDNKAPEQQQPAAPSTPVVNTPAATNNNSPFVTASGWDDFKTKVAAGTFSAPTIAKIEYIYQKCSSDTNKFLGIFTYQTNKCTSSFSRTLRDGVVMREDSLNSKAQVVTSLTTLINQVSSSIYYRQLSASAFQFQVGNDIYVINLAYPAEANPTYKYNISTGQGYQLSQYIALF